MKIIEKAISEKLDIDFIYTKYSGQTSWRRLSEISYCNEFGEFGYMNDHITGYCHLRRERRTFKISRMSEIRIHSHYNSSAPSPSRTFEDTRIAAMESLTNLRPEENNVYLHANNKSGCYIATMVYGDYNHSNVKILRNYRDTKLHKSFWGKIFIFIYYKLSPKCVRLFSRFRLFHNICKVILGIIVRYLKK
jgi:hypothetical protein